MQKMKLWKQFSGLLAAVLISLTVFTGCAENADGDTKIVLTTGFDKDEVFRIEKSSCRLPEIMLYLVNMQSQYENTFGSQIWDATYENKSLSDNVKDTVLARVAQIKTMNLMAAQKEITLSDTELEKANQAGTEYFQALSSQEIQDIGATEALTQETYREYALANKVYEALIADINPEISDDEARIITIQQILLKTYYVDAQGNKIAYDDAKKEEIYEKAKEAQKKAAEGADFSTLISEYSDDDTGDYSFGKGTYDAAFENAAFNLGTDEISGVVETKYGYHIMKCISTFDKDETDANKVKILEERRKEVFNEEYSGFVESLTRNLNDDLWNTVTLVDNSELTQVDFFEIYKKYFPKS